MYRDIEEIIIYRDNIKDTILSEMGSIFRDYENDKEYDRAAITGRIYEQVNKLLDDVNATADEYYENVAFANAYNVLVPASSSTVGFIRSLINGAMKPAVILEAAALLVYLCAAFIYGLRLEKGKLPEAEAKPEDKSADKQTEKKAKS